MSTQNTPGSLPLPAVLYLLQLAPFAPANSAPRAAMAATLAYSVRTGAITEEHPATLARLFTEVVARRITLVFNHATRQWMAVQADHAPPHARQWVVTGDTGFLAAARAVIADEYGHDERIDIPVAVFTDPVLDAATRIAPLPLGVAPSAWAQTINSIVAPKKLHGQVYYTYHATIPIDSLDNPRALPIGSVVVQYYGTLKDTKPDPATAVANERVILPRAKGPMSDRELRAHYDAVGFVPTLVGITEQTLPLVTPDMFDAPEQ